MLTLTKFRILTCLLVANIVLSLQAVTVINYTHGVMELGNFGYNAGDEELIDDRAFEKLFFCQVLNTDAWDKTYHFMTVFLYGKKYYFEDLEPETLIVFEDTENYDVSFQRYDHPKFTKYFDPLVIVNNTTTEITLSKFAGEIKNFEYRYQIDRKPVVLAPGDRIELYDDDCILDRMHVTGKDYYLTNGIFRNLKETASFPSAYFPALAYTRTLTFYMNKNKMIGYKKSKERIASIAKDPLIIVNMTDKEIILSDFQGKKFRGLSCDIQRNPVILAPRDRIELYDDNCKIIKLKINGKFFKLPDRYIEIIN